MRPVALSLALTIGAITNLGPALAQPQVYEYRVEHPVYGEIGTYTNVVDEAGDRVDVHSILHVAVKFLGVSVYRQDADSAEHWENGRLVMFHSATTTNGERMEVSGSAQEEGFMIKRPTGLALAPANIHPSNPWSTNILGSDMIMSTKTGKLFNVRLGRTEEKLVDVHGHQAWLREYQVIGEKRQVLWLDEEGTPVGFRTEEDGTQINFVLARHAVGNHEPHPWRGVVPEIGKLESALGVAGN
jgi:hypothetical protein